MRTSSMLVTCTVTAATLAGSAAAGVIDNFQTSFDTTVVSQPIAGNQREVLSVLTGATFSQRYTTVFNQYSQASSSGNGSMEVTLGQATAGNQAYAEGLFTLEYSDGIEETRPMRDLTGITSFSIHVGNYAGDATSWFLLVSSDSNTYSGADASLTLSSSNIQNGVLTFRVQDLIEGSGGSIAWNRVGLVSLEVRRTLGAPGSTVSFSLSNFEYNVVPAPGAIALLAATGLAGSRRRRA